MGNSGGGEGKWKKKMKECKTGAKITKSEAQGREKRQWKKQGGGRQVWLTQGC